MSLDPGIYELVVTRSLQSTLATMPRELLELAELDPAEAHRLLARHVAGVLERVLHQQGTQADARQRLELQLRLCAEVLRLLERREEEPTGQQLLGVVSRDPSGVARRPWPRPRTPLSDSALLVNASQEPTIASELEREIESADGIDLLCAFIKWHGLRLLLEPLKRFVEREGKLRVLTSTYMGVTEVRPLEELRALGAQVRVTYETEATRLHAKAWLFHRASGFTTAYIGSSNLSRSALIDGLEWNVRLSARETPAVIDRFRSAFDTYWESFVEFDAATFRKQLERERAQDDATADVAVLDVEPRPHQVRMLYELDVARAELGQSRNLVVAATGTGKTLVAAFDFERLRRERPGARLLFVAHRREILVQSRAKYRAVLREPGFGELFVGGERPTEWRHVFASVQSLDQLEWPFAPEHFDVVVIDEFHHAEAPTYRRLLERLRPWQLLGLTATPERGDGTNVADQFFGGRIAVELRLWDALEQGLLSPFHYFGVGSEVDLAGLTFKRGQGYELAELENVFTRDDVLAREVLQAAQRTLPSLGQMRALGFCVSVKHAAFMADRFNRANLPSAMVSGESSPAERAEALARLQSGALRALFTVDLFNEGVDVPDVDTLFLLRPTESPTLFLQQLGRGLRKRPGKVLTVLDFVGHQHAQFRVDRKYRALLGGSRQGLRRQLEDGVGFLPHGCHFELDPVAKEHVLENLRRALSLRWDGLARELRALGDVPLSRWLEETGLDLADFYRGTTGDRGLAALRRAAGFASPEGPLEAQLARAVQRCLHVNDAGLLDGWLEALRQDAPPVVRSERHRLELSMLSALLWDRQKFESLEDALATLWRHPGVRRELREVFELLRARVDHRGLPLGRPLPAPLKVHCRYSLTEVLAAFGEHRPERPLRTQAGVHYVKSCDVDLFFVTLKKSEREYSPTTMYRDYALSPTLFHWESQADQRPEAEAPRRYIQSAREGRGPLLFVREAKETPWGATAAYTLLGAVRYVKHEGSEPIAFTWQLEHAMPPDVYACARAVSG
jgi:superfamily II DNA or RNA helicase/HKD family nuclease